MSIIYIYWDESHFWGLMARRALLSWGVRHRFVRGNEIAHGLLADNPPDLLLVPGGWARGKADRLGPDGLNAVRDYVHGGGSYLGFCGGAGLALRDGGLGLCPWQRRGFTDRMQHFLSGHVLMNCLEDHSLVPFDPTSQPLLPVWWPGRFEPDGGDVDVLASYLEPGPDFWVADLALRSLPEGTLTDWEALYGMRVRPAFQGQPCVLTGTFGKGRYVLSYAHLETPASPDANQWLGHLLLQLGGIEVPKTTLPAWDVSALPVDRDDPALLDARDRLLQLARTGVDNLLLFWRTPWLLGWRRGLPGAALNSLLCMVCEALAAPETESARTYWQEHGPRFAKRMALFSEGVTGYLLAERLSMTAFSCNQDGLPGLREQRAALFGHPPAGGGMHAQLMHTLEELLWRL
ncbi:Biotin-protein ligase, N terminal [Paucidesulfovibrio gracilis DSM 16080]|uniref:Biotin-protein ligase, N terminal n=1 Tax=Paucidesulfovibrio gracilis DSM 16080 TaxID=1121449 RepID=A0A1T4Y802_9BACT|nr:BPL-N domain-containing protein [Paucidesulfovibrio gracilis]SKA97846.1 Biotin-protein ligase, N terminal [Paucidesulfovibrio gracilis DSM 16080]